MEDQTRRVTLGEESVCFHLELLKRHDELQGRATPLVMFQPSYRSFYLHNLINDMISAVDSKFLSKRINGRNDGGLVKSEMTTPDAKGSSYCGHREGTVFLGDRRQGRRGQPGAVTGRRFPVGELPSFSPLCTGTRFPTWIPFEIEPGCYLYPTYTHPHKLELPKTN